MILDQFMRLVVCDNRISNEQKNELFSLTDFIVAAADDYDIKAQVANLFLIKPDYPDHKYEYSIICMYLIRKLYECMVYKNKPARVIYDELLGAAPYGKCPFCGFGQATTLDHYLPKAKFSIFSILPINLIPACKDCNMGAKKTKSASTVEQQVIHPYYDQNLLSEQWLFAEVELTDPLSIKFIVKPPENWSDIKKERVKTHFEDFDLSRRFSIEAANELATLSNLSSIPNIDIKCHFKSIAEAGYATHKNSWKTAMYQALAEARCGIYPVATF